MNAIEFGKFLASIRNEKKLTQEELADKLFIDKRKISRWECGMSIPDFETIIKLCEILNVTPYEFSICKRLEKEKLSKKIINKFKTIKDFKKYKLKKKIILILSTILGIFFIFTAIYTFLYYGKVEIYEFRSLDENYVLNGTYVQTNKYSLYNISNVYFKNDIYETIYNFRKCKYEIYNNDIRLLEFTEENVDVNKKENNDLKAFYYGNISINNYANKNLTFKISCTKNNRQLKKYFINFRFIKKYDNKLF